MKIRGIIILAILLVLCVELARLNVAQPKPTVVVFAKGMLEIDKQLKWMIGNITFVNWKVYTDTITYDDLKGAKMLIIVLVDVDAEFTNEEISAIVKWFNEGGKTVWLCGDSDYKGGDYKRVPKMNKLAEALGTVLRNEHCEAVDRESNCGKPYRVAAIIDPDDPLKFLSNGISKPVLFHGPGVIVAYKDGKWYALEKEVPKNVYRIAWTSDKGAIAEFVSPLPQVHNVGYEGKLVVMATEIFPDKKNIVIYSAEAPFDHYRGMYIPSYHEVALDGIKFVTNIIKWGVSETFWTNYELSTLKEKINTLTNQINQLTGTINELNSKVNDLNARIAGLSATIGGAYAVGIIGIIVGIIGIVLAFRKPKPSSK